MTLFEFPFWKRWGTNGVAEWQTNWVILSKLAREHSNRIRESRTFWTITLHLWHGTLAGIVFGLLLPFLTVLPAGSFSVTLDALVYSIALWVIFMLAPRRAFESAGGTRISDGSLSVALASHLVYGIFLGLLVPLA
jgi:Na+/H+ antiporter NhaA